MPTLLKIRFSATPDHGPGDIGNLRQRDSHFHGKIHATRRDFHRKLLRELRIRIYRIGRSMGLPGFGFNSLSLFRST